MILSASRTETILVPRDEIQEETRKAMLRLLEAHFDGVSETQFALDLSEKNWVLLIKKGEKLVGFSTLAIYERFFESEMITVVCSGDTIVEPQAWNSTALARGWIAAVKSVSREMGNTKCYWLLLTSGFRTYRFLPVFWKEFYPKYDSGAATPALLEYLARDRFGSDYLPASGIVRFRHPQRLAGELKILPIGRATDPHIAFFLARNPRWMNGDELVCLTELADENLTDAGRRMSRARTHELPLCRR